MASLKKKNELLKVLKKLDKSDFPEAGLIDDIILELETIKASIPEKENLSPYFDSVKILEDKYSTISNSITTLSQAIGTFGTTTDSKIATLSKEMGKVLKSLKSELDGIGLQIIELRGRGGGAMHRQFLNNGTPIATRYADINFIGNGVTITTSNDDTKKVTNLTLTASGGSSLITYSGNVDGVNQTFVCSRAPIIVFVDQGRSMQKVSNDGEVNWTGTTTIVLEVAPNSDLFML